MSYLVERLRNGAGLLALMDKHAEQRQSTTATQHKMLAAADEIERLQAELAEARALAERLAKPLRKALAVLDGRLRGIVIMTDDCEGTLSHEAIKEGEAALEALASPASDTVREAKDPAQDALERIDKMLFTQEPEEQSDG